MAKGRLYTSPGLASPSAHLAGLRGGARALMVPLRRDEGQRAGVHGELVVLHARFRRRAPAQPVPARGRRRMRVGSSRRLPFLKCNPLQL